MKYIHEDMAFYVTITLLVVGFILFFSIYGPVNGHSFFPNYNWMPAFSSQFAQGDFYPRWLYDNYAGAGSPAFYFYGPMPLWIVSTANILYCNSCSSGELLMVGPTIMMGLASVSCYYFIKSFASNRIALVTAIVYLFLPYHFIVDFWIRSTWGELAAYIFMPLILLSLKNSNISMKHTIFAALCYAGLLYSHLPTAFLFSPFLLLYACLNFGIIKGLQNISIVVLVGVGLASAYLIPALTTQGFINPVGWEIYNPVDFLYFSGKDSMSKGKFVAPAIFSTILVTLISIIGFLRKDIKQDPLLQTAFISVICGTILISDLSQPLWQHISLLKKVQFPWRMGSILDLSAIIVFALTLRSLEHKKIQKMTYSLMAFLFIFGLVLVYSSRLKDRMIFSHGEVAIEDFTTPGFEPSEYRTVWLAAQYPDLRYSDLHHALEQTPDLAIIEGTGIIIEEKVEGDQYHIKLSSETGVKIRLRRFFYPGWHLLDSKNSSIEYPITVSPHYALIEASIPAGEHSITLLRKPFFEETLGMGITLLSLLFCIIIIFWPKIGNMTISRS